MGTREFVVRFAGEGGQGVVTAAEMLARTAATVGYHTLTFVTFPSQIMGGPTWAQARISTEPVLSPGDAVDILIALNAEAFHNHVWEVREGGVVLYDATFDLPEEYRGLAVGIPFEQLAKEAGGARSINMVMLGALARLVGMPLDYFRTFVERRFAGREEVIASNMKALQLGYAYTGTAEVQVAELDPPHPPDTRQLLLKGNDAIALGAMAAGVEFFAGYPISPATPILVFMERHLVGPGRFVVQCSSEIEAINAVVGAGYAGKKAMTATSGPGFTLMGEGISLAWMAEIPCVVVDVQRGGPSTGLPTKTEQSDLFTVLFPAHGDLRLPVIAPGSVEECFYAMIYAFNWAERYQGPVVVLSEHSLAERTQNVPAFDLNRVPVERRRIYEGEYGQVYLRYESEDLSPFSIPGRPGAYVANGSEHDPYGDTTHRPQHHLRMTRRRFRKLALLNDGFYEKEGEEHPIVVMPWGGSKGPAREAYLRLREEGLPLGWYFTMFLNPLPPGLLEELRGKELVLVPELNYQGQFATLLRSYGVRAEPITQYTGLPFRVGELAQHIRDRVEAHREGRVRI